jgi:hypothetical protein
LKSEGAILHNAYDVVNFLRISMSLLHAAYAIARQLVQLVFWEIKIGDIDRTHGFDCRIVSDSCKMHSIRSRSHYNKSLLQTRDYPASVAIALMDHQVFLCL